LKHKCKHTCSKLLDNNIEYVKIVNIKWHETRKGEMLRPGHVQRHVARLIGIT